MAKIAPYTFQQFFDNNGDPLALGKIYTYESGTTTNKATFTDADGLSSNTNPIILDANGRANIWLGDGAYTFKLTTSADVEIETVDDITGEVSSLFGADFFTVNTNTLVNSGYQNGVILVDTAAVVLSLVSASTLGEGFYFSVKNQSAGNITVDPDGSETIDGAATLTIGAGGSFLIISDGTNWKSLYGPTIYAGGTNTWTGENTFSDTIKMDGKWTTADDGERTISGGSISITGVYHTVDTQSNAATDDLDTISTTANGLRCVLRAENASRVVTIKHNTGNILCPNGVDIVLNTTNKVVNLIYDSELAKWVVTDLTNDYVDAQVTTAKIYSATAVASTSGTSIDFTSLPSGIKRIAVLLSGISTSGTSPIIVQIGDSGGVETSGYNGAIATDGASLAMSSGFNATRATVAANAYYGTLDLYLVDAATFTWAASVNVAEPNTGPFVHIGAGTKALSATLDRIRITTAGGADTFDAGLINIQYEL